MRAITAGILLATLLAACQPVVLEQRLEQPELPAEPIAARTVEPIVEPSPEPPSHICHLDTRSFEMASPTYQHTGRQLIVVMYDHPDIISELSEMGFTSEHFTSGVDTGENFFINGEGPYGYDNGESRIIFPASGSIHDQMTQAIAEACLTIP